MRAGTLVALLAGLVAMLFAAGPASASADLQLDPHWGGSAPGDVVRTQPRDGSRIIEQPMSLSLLAPRTLRSATFSVTDGCGKAVKLGRAEVQGHAAGVWMPGQRAAVGGWRVRWTAVDTVGRTSTGSWGFALVSGYDCAGRSTAGSTSHHENELAAQLRANDDAGQKPAQHPVLAAVLAVLIGVLVTAGAVRIARRFRVPTGSPADLTALVLIQTAVIGVASAGNGTTTWVRFALAVPTGLLATVLALRAAGAFRSWPVRSLVAGLVAGGTTAAVGAVWAMGRSALFVVAPTRTFGGHLDLAVATAVAAGVLCAGGWYASTPPTPSPSTPDPADAPEPVLPAEV